MTYRLVWGRARCLWYLIEGDQKHGGCPFWELPAEWTIHASWNAERGTQNGYLEMNELPEFKGFYPHAGWAHPPAGESFDGEGFEPETDLPWNLSLGGFSELPNLVQLTDAVTGARIAEGTQARAYVPGHAICTATKTKWNGDVRVPTCRVQVIDGVLYLY